MPTDNNTKKCTKCIRIKHLSEFYRLKNKYETRCKVCLKAYSALWFNKNKDKCKATNAKRYQKNRIKLIADGCAYAKKNAAKFRERAMARHAAKLLRTPKWLTDFDWIKIRQLYKHANYLTKKTGIKYEVDHIYPLQGELISGLHVPTNLRIITKSENCSKNNKFEVA